MFRRQGGGGGETMIAEGRPQDPGIQEFPNSRLESLGGPQIQYPPPAISNTNLFLSSSNNERDFEPPPEFPSFPQMDTVLDATTPQSTNQKKKDQSRYSR